jgi:hypothetical protein
VIAFSLCSVVAMVAVARFGDLGLSFLVTLALCYATLFVGLAFKTTLRPIASVAVCFMLLFVAGIDLSFTIAYIAYGPLRESNDIANAVLVRFGVPGLIVFKSITTLFPAVLLFTLRRGNRAVLIALPAWLVSIVLATAWTLGVPQAVRMMPASTNPVLPVHRP